MEFKELVRKRRTVRKYTGEDVSAEQIKEVLEDAIWSPSACNRQPWYFVVVKNPEAKKKIAELAFKLPQMKNASAILAIFSDLGKYCDSSTREQVEQNRYYYFDAGVVLQTIALSAFDRGIGTCMMAGRLARDEIREALGVPDNYVLCGLMSFGVPDGMPPAPKRDAVEKYFDVDRYSGENKSAKGKSDQTLWSQATGRIKRYVLKH